jgi:hypothetical protein
MAAVVVVTAMVVMAATVAAAVVAAVMLLVALNAGRRCGVGVRPYGHARRECDDHGQHDPQ